MSSFFSWLLGTFSVFPALSPVPPCAELQGAACSFKGVSGSSYHPNTTVDFWSYRLQCHCNRLRLHCCVNTQLFKKKTDFLYLDSCLAHHVRSLTLELTNTHLNLSKGMIFDSFIVIISIRICLIHISILVRKFPCVISIRGMNCFQLIWSTLVIFDTLRNSIFITHLFLHIPMRRCDSRI